MQINRLSTILITDKFDAIKDFYITVLQQEIESDFGNCIGFKSGISIWELKPHYPIATRLGRTYDDSDNKNLEICFEVDDFEETIRHIQQYELSYLHTEVEESWGQKTVRFYDPENNLIEVGESIPAFIRRLHEDGMSKDELVKKTGCPLSLIEDVLK